MSTFGDVEKFVSTNAFVRTLAENPGPGSPPNPPESPRLTEFHRRYDELLKKLGATLMRELSITPEGLAELPLTTVLPPESEIAFREVEDFYRNGLK